MTDAYEHTRGRRWAGPVPRPAVAWIGCLVMAACSSAPPFNAEAVVSEWLQYTSRDHTLVPGDVIDISVSGQQIADLRVTVSAEGAVSLPRLERPVIAGGKSMSQFRQEVMESYRRSGTEPGVVSVTLFTPSARTVWVAGEVRENGAVPWSEQMTLAKAVASAGGMLVTAKPADIYITRADPATKAVRTFRANLDRIHYGESMDFPLLPGDVVFVQTSVGGDIAHFVDLWVRRVLPIDSIGGVLGIAAFSQTN